MSQDIPAHLVEFWKSSFASTSKGGFRDLKDFVTQFQALCRTYLSIKRSTSPQLTLTRYARAEAAVRIALAQCENEPTPLELQVRLMEKGLHVWQARVSRGYERSKKAEETIRLVRAEQENIHAPRNRLEELQKERWMGIKERDEALEMVGKIKELIKALNGEIKAGSKRSSLMTISSADPASRPHSHSRTHSHSDDPTTPTQTMTKKVSTLFTGRIPPPYLDNLPRSRQSVEPLQLPQLLASLPSQSTSTPSTPAPHTPTFQNEFGAVVIHAHITRQSVADPANLGLETDLETGTEGGHVRLPSYVDLLLNELGQDRLGSDCITTFGPLSTPLASNPNGQGPSVISTAGKSTVLDKEDNANISIPRRQRDSYLNPSLFPPNEGRLPRPDSRPTSTSMDGEREAKTPRSTSALTPASSATSRQKHKMGDIMRNVTRSVKRVSSKLTTT